LEEWVVLHLGSTIGSDAVCNRVIITQLIKMNRGHGRWENLGQYKNIIHPSFGYESRVLTVKRLVLDSSSETPQVAWKSQRI